MSRDITLQLSSDGIDSAIKELKDYKKEIQDKALRLCAKLSEMGAVSVSLGFARAVYTGPNDTVVTVDAIPNGYRITARGGAVLFCEFGSGATYGYGHPMAGTVSPQMGPGTYPDGKGHWNDPRGWYLPKDKGGGHTFGNPPNPVMYQAARDMRQEVLTAAREVFET